ncbi:MAG: hypothetical protein R3A44_18630 [Caldilineaceae bacterium]
MKQFHAALLRMLVKSSHISITLCLVSLITASCIVPHQNVNPIGYLEIQGQDEHNVPIVLQTPIHDFLAFGTFNQTSYDELTSVISDTVPIKYAVVRDKDRVWKLYSASPLSNFQQVSSVRLASLEESSAEDTLLAFDEPFPATALPLFPSAINSSAPITLATAIDDLQAEGGVSDLDGITAKYLLVTLQGGVTVTNTLITYELTSTFGDPGIGDIFNLREHCNSCGCACRVCRWTGIGC